MRYVRKSLGLNGCLWKVRWNLLRKIGVGVIGLRIKNKCKFMSCYFKIKDK